VRRPLFKIITERLLARRRAVAAWPPKPDRRSGLHEHSRPPGHEYARTCRSWCAPVCGGCDLAALYAQW